MSAYGSDGYTPVGGQAYAQPPPNYQQIPPQNPGYQPPQSNYQQVPQQQPPQAPPYGYPQPAYYPPGMQQTPIPQQQSNTNVVVVNQQPQPQTIVHFAPRAKTYLTLTAVMAIVCFLHGNLPAFVCLVPALIFASMAQSQNEAGDYNSALSYGKLALACNIATFVYYAMAVIGGIIALVLLFAVAGISNNPDQP